MKKDKELSKILDELYRSKIKTIEKEKNLERSLRNEAKLLSKKIQKESEEESLDEVSGAHLLDLESLKFVQGSRLMSNRTCKLPVDTVKTSFKVFI